MKKYDVIIIGAGSVGVPLALSLATRKQKVLVIDACASVGQENNKKAIGGIRATHSDFGKIKVSQKSIEIFSNWQKKYGDDIGWMANGYSFPAYTEADETKLKNLMKIQHSFGLNIEWISPKEYEKLVPGICTKNLRGATYSPEDGSASPLLAINAFYQKSLEFGATYKFKEKVVDLKVENGKISKIVTDKSEYSAGIIINASGNNATEIGRMVGLNLPVKSDSHEGAITEPVARFFGPMVVDMRPEIGSANYYFYQNNEGQVIFCITPSPPILGTDSDSTSTFLPQVAQRMVQLFPKLANLKVRRTWRGQYPMTSDGFPIVGKSREIPNLINAVGMCGQGYMLGPGLGELIANIVLDNLSENDKKALKSFNPYRDFSGMEAFK